MSLFDIDLCCIIIHLLQITELFILHVNLSSQSPRGEVQQQTIITHKQHNNLL